MTPMAALGVALGLAIGVVWYEFIEPRTRRRTVAGGKNRTYSFQQYKTEAKVRPFVLRDIPDETIGEVIIPVPSGNDLLAATEPQTSLRRMLEIICGDQFDTIIALFGPEAASALTDFLGDLMAHFGAGGAPGDSARPSS